jgi:multidrug efflux pump subunit AcrA (membrane-fusion protein)
MVMRPSIGQQTLPTAPVRARFERQMAKATSRKSRLSRLAQVAAQQKALRRMAISKSGRAAFAAARGIGAVAEGAMVRAGSTLLFNPIGLVLAGVAIAGVVALRIASGKPLEGTGAQINRMVLGDMDDEARARMAVGQRIMGDDRLLEIMGKEGKVNAQIKAIRSDMLAQETEREIGASRLREGFPVNGIVDMVILRMQNLWNDLLEDGTLDKIALALRAAMALRNGINQVGTASSAARYVYDKMGSR